jgi:hypothetical protein
MTTWYEGNKANWPYKRQWWGWTNLGPIQIPPQPEYQVFIDRADNTTKWYLTFDPAQVYPDGLGTIAVTTVLPAIVGKGGYAAFQRLRAQFGTADPTQPIFPLGASTPNQPIFEEPYISNMPQGFSGKLFVRGGTLGVDIFTADGPARTQSQVMDRVLGQTNANGELIFAMPLNGLVGFGNHFRRIIWKGDIATGFVSWSDWLVTQTPNPPNVNSAANLFNPKADV